MHSCGGGEAPTKFARTSSSFSNWWSYTEETFNMRLLCLEVQKVSWNGQDRYQVSSWQMKRLSKDTDTLVLKEIQNSVIMTVLWTFKENLD